MENKIFLIEWIDSYDQYKSWTSLSDIEEPISMPCLSVGWIVKENKEAITIAPHLANIDDEDFNCLGLLTIPKIAIIKKTKLKL